MFDRIGWGLGRGISVYRVWVVLFPVVFQVAQAQDSPNPYRTISTIAGNGQTGKAVEQGRAIAIALSNPFGVQPDTDGSLIVASFDQHSIYRLDPAYKRVTRIVGTGRQGLSGRDGDRPTQVDLNRPHEVQVDRAGNILLADTSNHRIGMLDATTGRWKTIAGTGVPGFGGDGGPAARAQLDQAYSIAVHEDHLYIADLGNHRIRHVDLNSGRIETLCGNGTKGLPKDGGVGIEQPLAGPRSLAVDAKNLWIVLREGNSVWRLERATGRIFHVAGTGQRGFSGDGGDARLAKLAGPKGIAVQPQVALFIADTENHAIRWIDLQRGSIKTLVGSKGTAGFNGDGDHVEQRQLNRPHGVCLLPEGELLIGDSENHRLRILRH